ncbi:hypothetical protein LTR64_000790 [Lithohypha guttulata]|uniref:uncharacterized protein n=1 Tax=Lithohypha guttulata TaxID=1690604 RepID=UPI002DDDCA21|nr:hypothetical protein LTR51_005444 [Lithohypha guttulata]
MGRCPPYMPSYGCEHLNRDILNTIKSVRESRSNWLEDLVHYTCLDCEETGSFITLNKHHEATKHGFAVNAKHLYCMRCRDLVYDPSTFKSRKRKQLQLSEEDETYISTNTVPKPCGREGVRGLFNLGETCYMNAVLQMMVHNNLLAQYFLGMGHPVHTCPISREPEKKNDSDDSEDELAEDKEQKTCVACAMTEVFSDANTVDQPVPAHAVNLLFASWKHIPIMSGKGQQDAQEWFTIIIDKLHESAVNPSQNPAFKPNHKKHCLCFFHKVFYGRFLSDVACDVCHKTTTTESEYSSIDLDFQKQKKRKKKLMKEAAAASAPPPASSANAANRRAAAAAVQQLPPPVPTLSECLKAYTSPEALFQESQQIDCQTCKRKTTAQKCTRVRKLPAILTMHVKRFGMKKPPGATTGSNGLVSSLIGTPEKYEGKLDFPLVLDMHPYTTHAQPNGSYRDRQHCIYDLECVVVHQGDHAHTGHYYAFCRVAVGEGKEMKWFKFDDEIVSATTTEEVLRQEAYLLFYGLRDIPSVCGPSVNGETNGKHANGTTNGDVKMEES